MQLISVIYWFYRSSHKYWCQISVYISVPILSAKLTDKSPIFDRYTRYITDIWPIYH
ncbi:hypothetical protein Hanom_Chr03g00277501 [Helianthus anomalus]